MLSAGRRACRRVCWGGAGVCSCGAPAAARRLPARVWRWRAEARRLISARSHQMKPSAGSTRPTQSPSQTPQGGNTTGGKQHKGETAHGETRPPTLLVLPPVTHCILGISRCPSLYLYISSPFAQQQCPCRGSCTCSSFLCANANDIHRNKETKPQ